LVILRGLRTERRQAVEPAWPPSALREWLTLETLKKALILHRVQLRVDATLRQLHLAGGPLLDAADEFERVARPTDEDLE